MICLPGFGKLGSILALKVCGLFSMQKVESNEKTSLNHKLQSVTEISKGNICHHTIFIVLTLQDLKR